MSDVDKKLNKLGLSDEQSQIIGERLKDARISLRLSLKDLSTKIKIQEHFLKGMEEGSFDILPTPVHGRGLLRVYAKELKVELPELNQTHRSVENQSELINKNSTGKNFKAESSKNTIITPSLHDILGIDLTQKTKKQKEHKRKEQTNAKEALNTEKNKEETAIPHPKIIHSSPVKVEKKESTQAYLTKEKKTVSPLGEIGKNLLLLLGQLKGIFSKNKSLKWPIISLFVIIMICLAGLTLKVMVVKQNTDKDIVSLPISQNKEQGPEKTFESEELSQRPVIGLKNEEQYDKLNEKNEEAFENEVQQKVEDTPEGQERKTIANEPPKTDSISTIAAPEKVLESAKEATLNIIESVELRIIVDGKQTHSGITKAGIYKLVFNKQADLFIDDGSRVKLNYENWDLGVLGHEGRKRKIVLNAQENN